MSGSCLRLLPFLLLAALPAAQAEAFAPAAVRIEAPLLMQARVRPVPPLGDLGPLADVGLLGQTSYWQAFVGDPPRSTNLVRTVVSDL